MIYYADSEKRIQAFEIKCMRKPVPIFHLEHKTNDWSRSKMNLLVVSIRISSGNCQETETCTSHASTASPKPSFRAS